MYKNWGRRTALSSCGVLLLSLSGCQSMLNFDSVDSVKELSKQVQDADSLEDVKAIAKQAKVTRDYIRADLKAIQTLYKNLDQQVNKKWGKDNSQLPNKKKYVKYVNDYQARAIVDFDNGKVRVETVDGRNPRDTLTKAVTTTLLTTADPTKTDIFSSSAPNTDGVPFLYPQVVDNEGVLVKYRWRAGRYAQYLVANKLQPSTSSGNLVYSVEFDLVEKHEHLRQKNTANTFSPRPNVIT